MSTYPDSTLRRIKSDLKLLHEEPLENISVKPREHDLTLWDAIIYSNDQPFHLLIDFPTTYPHSSPNIGFSVKFPFNKGASFVETSGRCKGLFVLCLDILGNFSRIHTEWKNQVGSGWSPAYTATSLLLNLQSLLAEVKISKALATQLKKFADENPEKILLPPTSAELAKARKLLKIKESLPENFQKLTEMLGLTRNLEKMEIVSKFASETNSSSMIDSNIRCYSTNLSYKEDILGYGISAVQTGRHINLSTPGELLSWTAFKEGLRQSSTKIQFQYFLPAFINPDHSINNPLWQKLMKSAVVKMGRVLYDTEFPAEAAYYIFPKLINTMVVEIMKDPEDETPIEWNYEQESYETFMKKQTDYQNSLARVSKAASTSYFEALCSFWRSYYWISQTVCSANLLPNSLKIVKDFVQKESSRLKSEVPDLGCLITVFSAVQTHQTNNVSCPELTSFIDVFLEENFIRQVMWWRKSQKEGNTNSIFHLTKVSRELVLFQLLFLKKIIGRDPSKTAIVLDLTNGKPVQLLEQLLSDWKRLKAETNSWLSFYKATGCSQRFYNRVTNNGCMNFLDDCVAKAKKRGRPYGF